jgi:hypothetical protein
METEEAEEHVCYAECHHPEVEESSKCSSAGGRRADDETR